MLPSHAQINKFVLLHKEFDPDDAELTRTRKIRRSFVKERYHELIDAIYGKKEQVQIEASVKYRDGREGKISTAIKIMSVGGI